jgi:ABC-type multidrug transport system ATPase subunit
LTNNVIEVVGLAKKYGSFQAVEDISFTVQKGEIYGFLGPNGSGKSTTIRMMLTLIKADKGTVRFFGHDIHTERKQALSKIGALVEKPDFYLYLSAYRNLEYFASLSMPHAPSKKQIYDMLELVGLIGKERNKVKTYSLGMKQRLGIAQALIHDPEIIILDEPTNGLDPQGMKEMRDLLINLSRDKGKTILLSSHILSEIESIADSMVIINKGKVLVEGKVIELLNKGELKVNLTVLNEKYTSDFIKKSDYASALISEFSNSFVLRVNAEDVPKMLAYLAENKIEILSLVPLRSLEEYFLNITQ